MSRPQRRGSMVLAVTTAPFDLDLGGGTFDVSIVVIEDGSTVLGSGGDTRLGGEDLMNVSAMVLRDSSRA